MAKQLSTGRWLARKETSASVSIKIVDTEEEANEYESGR